MHYQMSNTSQPFTHIFANLIINRIGSAKVQPFFGLELWALLHHGVDSWSNNRVRLEEYTIS
jgi:hypothetical protein